MSQRLYCLAVFALTMFAQAAVGFISAKSAGCTIVGGIAMTVIIWLTDLVFSEERPQ